MKMISLFDGSGGFPLAAYMCGIESIAASEIEPFPIRVTTKRFPNMKHLGDISKINGSKIEPVDIITFGSPCQDLSIAGKRKGLKHEGRGDKETTRSGLFMEAIRIIKEMRGATNGRYPTFAIWENVPGAFSSNKGEDFRAVLEEFAKISDSVFIPEPPKGKWLRSGEVVGDHYSVAWRAFDAQYWGVPQRRRRIYLVADFRGQRAGKILFEREGLRGYFETGRTPWKGTAADAERSVDSDDRERKGRREPIAVATQQGGEEISENGICPTITAAAGMSGNNQPWICTQAIKIKDQYLFENHSADSRYTGPLDACTKLPARLGTGGNNTPFVVERNAEYWDGSQICGTLTANNAGGNQGMPDKNNFNCVIEEITGPVVAYRSPITRYIVRRLTPTECARLQGFPDYWTDCLETEEPAEKDLLFWREVFETHRKVVTGASKPKTDKQIIKWLKNPYSDSAAYKMWGNGIALPNALYIMQGIYDELTIQ